jgi:hypothetical protein
MSLQPLRHVERTHGPAWQSMYDQPPKDLVNQDEHAHIRQLSLVSMIVDVVFGHNAWKSLRVRVPFRKVK